MWLELTLIIVSALGMAGVLTHKRVESSRQFASVQSVRQRTDPILQNLHHTTGRVFSYFTIHNGILLANYVFVYVVRFCMNTSQRVHDTSARIVDKASRKTEDLSRGGAASFYLKKIKENKDSQQTTNN
jgi:hypothetical protein